MPKPIGNPCFLCLRRIPPSSNSFQGNARGGRGRRDLPELLADRARDLRRGEVRQHGDHHDDGRRPSRGHHLSGRSRSVGRLPISEHTDCARSVFLNLATNKDFLRRVEAHGYFKMCT